MEIIRQKFYPFQMPLSTLTKNETFVTSGYCYQKIIMIVKAYDDYASDKYCDKEIIIVYSFLHYMKHVLQ